MSNCGRHNDTDPGSFPQWGRVVIGGGCLLLLMGLLSDLGEHGFNSLETLGSSIVTVFVAVCLLYGPGKPRAAGRQGGGIAKTIKCLIAIGWLLIPAALWHAANQRAPAMERHGVPFLLVLYVLSGGLVLVAYRLVPEVGRTIRRASREHKPDGPSG